MRCYRKAVDEMEQKLAAELGKGQTTELIEDDEVQTDQLIGEAGLPC